MIETNGENSIRSGLTTQCNTLNVITVWGATPEADEDLSAFDLTGNRKWQKLKGFSELVV